MSSRRLILAVSVPIITVCVIACGGGGSKPAPNDGGDSVSPPTEEQKAFIDHTTFPAGSTVVLSSGKGKECLVGIDLASLDDAIKAVIADEMDKVARLVATGRIQRIENGTAATVIENGLYWVKVKIGNGRHAGQVVYAYRELLQTPSSGTGTKLASSKTTTPIKPDPPRPDSEPVPMSALPPSAEIAPPPRRTNPFPARGWVGDWERAGEVDLRISGIALTQVPLVDPEGKRSESVLGHLVIWVEMRNVSKSKSHEYRRWQSLSDYVSLKTERDNDVPAAKLGRGKSIYGQGEFKQIMIPGGPSISDVLVFDYPGEGAGRLTLWFDLERVGETGKLNLKIPESAWAKK